MKGNVKARGVGEMIVTVGAWGRERVDTSRAIMKDEGTEKQRGELQVFYVIMNKED